MKVLVCGSRTYSDWLFMEGVLESLHVQTPIDVIIEGEAVGADSMAREWARYMGITTWKFPADWTKYGKAAGPIRNKEMLDKGPDLVLAFVDKPLAESRGTANMVKIAQEAGVEVRVYGRGA